MLKRILERLRINNTEEKDAKVLYRPTFLRNVLDGTHFPSAFEFFRGFCPPILGIPIRFFTGELMQVNIEQQSTRTLQRIIRTPPIKGTFPSYIKPGQAVLFYYKNNKNNDKDEWKPGHILTVNQFNIIVQSDTIYRTTKRADEDIRLRPE